MDDDPAPLEIISDSTAGDQSDDEIRTGTADGGIHQLVRTTCAVVGAGALLWLAVSAQSSRSTAEQSACLNELQLAVFLPGSVQSADRVQEMRALLSEGAEDCDLDRLHRLLREAAG